MNTAFIASLVLSCAAPCVLLLLCQTIGWSWMPERFAGFQKNPRIEVLVRLLASAAAGLWMISVGAMLWGMWVGLSAEKNLILLAGLFGLGWDRMGPVLRAYRNVLRGIRLSPAEKAAAMAVCLLVVWALVFALVPPLMTDAVRYHLGVPHLWWQMGRIERLPHFSEQHLIMIWQHAVLPLMGFEQWTAAKVFVFLAYPMTLATVGAAAFLHGGRGAAFVSVVLLAATPTFFGNGVLGGVDAGLAWFTAMAWLFWPHADAVNSASEIENRKSKIENRNWVWPGLMIGLAVGTKWQGLSVLGAFLLLTLWRLRGQALPAVCVITVAALGAFLPWAIRNVLWSGDPLYPFLSQFWNADAAAIAEKFQSLNANYGLSAEPWWQYLLYPLHLSFYDFPWWFGGRIEFESAIGPLYLLLSPLCIAASFKNRCVRLLLLFCFAAFCLGFAQGEFPRFWMPVWVGFSIAAGVSWSCCQERVRVVFLTILILFSGWNLWNISAVLNQPAFAPLAFYRLREAPDAFYLRARAERRTARWIHKHFPDSKVLLTGLDGVLFWENPVIADGPFDAKSIVLAARSNDMRAQLKAEGAELLVVDSGRAERLQSQFGYMGWDGATRKKVRQFLSRKVVQIHEDEGIRVGRMK